MRLDLALIAQYPSLSRRKARDVIEKGQVTVDGQASQEPGRLVGPTAVLRWDPNRKAERRARLSLPLLYRDASVLVVDKPAGLLTVPSSPDALGEDTALARVEAYVRHLTPRHPYVGVVHRIDRDTSGAVAFALSLAARRGLRNLFREHRIERRYSALVSGEARGERGVIDLPIRDSYAGGKRGIARAGEPSLPAVTRWTLTERLPGGALLEIELGTGRQHQIRIHLAHIGLPIVGDAVYGAPLPGRRVAGLARRQMLHARLLAFVNPLSGVRVHAESPLPEDFRKALSALRHLAQPSQAAHKTNASKPPRGPRDKRR
jgi:23S rRNA pseudouridine1911/1915/1917 synthase